MSKLIPPHGGKGLVCGDRDQLKRFPMKKSVQKTVETLTKMVQLVAEMVGLALRVMALAKGLWLSVAAMIGKTFLR